MPTPPLDDRGHPVRILDTRGGTWHGARHPRLAPMWNRVSIITSAYVGASVVLLAAGTMGAAALLMSILHIQMRFYGLLACSALMQVGLAGVYRRLIKSAWQRAGRRIIPLVLADGLCPQCTYNLHGLHAADDGCIACPECGAAWNSHRIQRTTELEDRFDDAAGVGPIRSASSNRPWARDGRGVRQPLLAKSDNPITIARDPAHLAALRDCMAQYPRNSLFLRIVAATPLLMGALIWSILIFDPVLRYRYGLAHVAIRAAPPLLIAAAALIIIIRGIGRQQRLLISLMLHRGLCPTCGGQLPATPAPDGCLECPTCGAAWKPVLPHHA